MLCCGIGALSWKKYEAALKLTKNLQIASWVNFSFFNRAAWLLKHNCTWCLLVDVQTAVYWGKRPLPTHWHLLVAVEAVGERMVQIGQSEAAIKKVDTLRKQKSFVILLRDQSKSKKSGDFKRKSGKKKGLRNKVKNWIETWGEKH